MSNSNIELSLPSEWDNDQEMMDEEHSAVSSEEASKVFEQWQTDEENEEMDIMDVDEQLGSNLLGDELFPDPCSSPTGPLEELTFLTFDNEEVDKFSLSLLNFTSEDKFDEPADDSSTSSKPFEERYKESLKKLADSMKRSQETRKSLVMKTDKTQEYMRRKSVAGVIKSIEKSTTQLQSYLSTARCA
mmetsp:Transcript_7889/g.15287  ORF Transcript_7889/g.15287 Transcript_7889/m.15287 type:complete len:188 (-) Transcript_7889:301-864(-)|eukprot:scaffold118_cov185-Amphora_coffeaeformis.AAC.17